MLARGTSEYPRWGSGEMEVTKIELLNAEGQPGLVFNSGDHFTVRMHYKAHEDCREPVFGLGIYRSDGTYVNGSNHHWRDQPISLGQVLAGEEGEVDMAMGTLPLLEGQYYLTSFLYDHSVGSPTAIDHQEHALSFEVLDPNQQQHGILYLPTAWAVRRRPREGEDSVLESGS